MIYCGYLLCYLPFSPVFPPLNTKDTTLKIGSDLFFLTGIETFESFEFKSNKRGGESANIKFSKMFGNYKVNDKVFFTLEGQKVFSGVIERITNYGLNVDVVPTWVLLDYIFITDTLEFESTETIYKIVLSLEDKILRAGIGFNKKNVEIPEDITITTSLSGRSIRDILDELEQGLPNNFVYGVDAYNEFYFKSFSEIAEKKLSWFNADFSKSEYETDTSNLISQYVVKVKDLQTNTYNVLKQIVGDDNSYPPTAFTDIVGKKTEVFEYNFPAEAGDALDLAYKYLKMQVQSETLKLSTLNYKQIQVFPNEAIETTLKPIENFYEDFNIDYSTALTISNGLNIGEIVKIGLPISYARKVKENADYLDFSEQVEYMDACNRSLYIYKIIVYYHSTKSADRFSITDNKKSIVKFGEAGKLEVDVDRFSKRTLKVKVANASNKEKVIFYKMRCYFTQGSRKLTMNVRDITYSYKKGILSVNTTLAKINASLVGHFREQERLKKLENLLTNSPQ